MFSSDPSRFVIMVRRSIIRPKNFSAAIPEHINAGAEAEDAICTTCFAAGRGIKSFVKSWKCISNLKRHNATHHNFVEVSSDDSSVDEGIAGHSKRPKKPIPTTIFDFWKPVNLRHSLHPKERRKFNFEAKCALAIAVDLAPISSFRKQGLRSLLIATSGDSNLELPSDYFFKKGMAVLADIAENVADNIMGKLQGISISFDGWSSSNGTIAINAFYGFGVIDGHWTEFIIDTIGKHGSSDANSTFSVIESLINRKSMTNEVLNHRYAWVTDKPSVNNVLFRDYMPHEVHLWCVAHRLNLVIQHAHENLKKEVSGFRAATVTQDNSIGVDLSILEMKVRKIVTHFRKSHQATFRFDETCVEIGKKALRFLADCPTRWTGRFFSWSRMLEQREAIETHIVNLKDSIDASRRTEGKWLVANRLTVFEWTIMEAMVPLLGDFVAVITAISLSGPTVGLVYPLLKNVRNSTLMVTLSDSAVTKIIKEELLNSLNFYFSGKPTSSVKSGNIVLLQQHHFHEEVLLLGWFFDPSQFSSRIVTGQYLQELLMSVVDVWQRVFQRSVKVGERIHHNVVDTRDDQAIDPLSILGLVSDVVLPSSKIIMNELHQYLGLLIQLENGSNSIELLKNIDVLEWWFAHRCDFPMLYQLSRVVLSVPAAATTCERFFSVCGLTVTDRRSRLKLDTCRSLWLARTLYSDCGIEEVPFLDDYINRRVESSSDGDAHA